ncbi:lymphocyte antigen 6E-like [Rhinatrema bivittatum]|uniref:lymphocyte antigen 6E-like n=1 Tax=Rhinatrema bivittatum TaxID=194408 RepID=UPI00112DCF8D|nr:lymphocyte antigen 6E-like [Rhinatrema bivittatum]
MKELLTISLAATLFVGLAQSLECFSCKDALSDSSCTSIQNCSESDNYCLSYVVNIVMVNLMNKHCAPSCETVNGNFLIVNVSGTCCSSDLCNNGSIGSALDFSMFNGASGGRIGFWPLVSAAGLICTLLLAGL